MTGFKKVEMMKNLSKIWIGLVAVALLTYSCDSLLDVDSERYVLAENHQLDSPNDTIYNMVGIFSQLSKLMDRYVLLGEVRADLVDVTANATPYITELNDFVYADDNPYIDKKDYYEVINNCNFLIQNIDTAIVSSGAKVMYKEYAAAKAIRAWTYMQLVLNFGSAVYYEEPILDISDAENEYPEYQLNELADALIADLLPWKEIGKPGSISLGSNNLTTSRLFFPIKFQLGDLYLWKGEYENAATQYYDLMVDREYQINENYRALWEVENNAFVSKTGYWDIIFSINTLEQITLLAASTELGEGAELDTISLYKYEIAPSEVALKNWESQVYYHTASLTTEGDLRGEDNSYYDLSGITGISTGSNSTVYKGEYGNVITKYYSMSNSSAKAIILYRTGLLYLRYAEAINRSGRPNLAFATLKNGLSAETMSVDSIVPPREKYNSYTETMHTFNSFTDFEDIMFDDSRGVHERGSGNVYLAKDYKIPELSSLDDSIEYVENKIVEELALETAFEGNRFHDLMRIAIRRNDPVYLADKVAAKHTENKAAIRAKLEDMNNWYLPSK